MARYACYALVPTTGRQRHRYPPGATLRARDWRAPMAPCPDSPCRLIANPRDEPSINNLIFNLRILFWHIQVERGRWYPTVSANPYHRARGSVRPFIELY